ncbi:helix-turn-helix domain-containing protein [Selenomonas infelix]|nr:helix-turn-helix domain-containing protein [Selenomonas infelix]
MAFSDTLKKLRLSKGLTQEELANGTGLAKSSISMYESGRRKPSFEVLEAFADFFNVDMNTLWETPAAEKPSSPSKRDMNDLAKFLNKTEVLFDGDIYRLDEEDQQKLRSALEFVFWDAKRQNKRKKD